MRAGLLSTHKVQIADFFQVNYLLFGLQISDWNDFFIDEKLNGLFFPVINITFQFISVHTYQNPDSKSKEYRFKYSERHTEHTLLLTISK